jgi:hypothetical protein
VAKNVPGVLATYRHVDAATESIRSLRRQGRKDLTVYSAAPNHEIETALGHKVSPVRLFTLLGGITGCTGGPGHDLLDVARLAAAGGRQADRDRCPLTS